MKQRILKIQEVYREGKERLKASGIEDADLDAWYLLEHITGITKASYYGDPDREISPDAKKEYDACIEKRCQRIPLQHLTGTQEFMGLSFVVNGHVLIPRQDTETLVEQGIKILDDSPGNKDVLDVCTGSGCILISLVKLCSVCQVRGRGTDISEKALEVAKENARCHGVEAEFIQSDIFEQLPDDRVYDMIISNPPYIRTSEIGQLQAEVRLYDPFIALDGKEDGLYFYREITEKSRSYIKSGGWLVFETGCDQAEEVKRLMQGAGYSHISVKKDLAGLDRVVLGRYNGK